MQAGVRQFLTRDTREENRQLRNAHEEKCLHFRGVDLLIARNDLISSAQKKMHFIDGKLPSL